MSLLLNIVKCTEDTLIEATISRSYHKLIKRIFRIFNLKKFKSSATCNLKRIFLIFHTLISHFLVAQWPLWMSGWKQKQPQQISYFWFQALWYLAAALIEPLKFLSAHAGSAGWLTKHFFLQQKLCLFSPLCESVTLCRSWSICLMNRRWISLSCRECCIEAGAQLVNWNVSQVGRCYLDVGGCSVVHISCHTKLKSLDAKHIGISFSCANITTERK